LIFDQPRWELYRKSSNMKRSSFPLALLLRPRCALKGKLLRAANPANRLCAGAHSPPHVAVLRPTAVPAELADEIIANLEAGLTSFRLVLGALQKTS
jgi:hypothetical protein